MLSSWGFSFFILFLFFSSFCWLSCYYLDMLLCILLPYLFMIDAMPWDGVISAVDEWSIWVYFFLAG